MLQANELMIGDWVYCRYLQKNVKVEEIKTVADDELRIIISDGIPIVFAMRYIEPIPLTPEILEKNGFVANRHVYPYPYYEYINEEEKLKVGFAFPQGNKTSYKEPWVYIDSERVFVEHLPCAFVHQLQQILRFCGIKKTITI